MLNTNKAVDLSPTSPHQFTTTSQNVPVQIVGSYERNIFLEPMKLQEPQKCLHPEPKRRFESQTWFNGSIVVYFLVCECGHKFHQEKTKSEFTEGPKLKGP